MSHYEWEYEYYRDLPDFAVVVERLLMAAVLVLFGGAIAGGLLEALSQTGVLFGLALVFVVGPLSGLRHWLLSSTSRSSFTGSFLLPLVRPQRGDVPGATAARCGREALGNRGATVLASIVVHGVAAIPIMEAVERVRDRPVA